MRQKLRSQVSKEAGVSRAISLHQAARPKNLGRLARLSFSDPGEGRRGEVREC